MPPLLVLSLAGAGAATGQPAQEAPGERAPRAHAYLEAGGGVTLLHGDVAPFFRGAALVTLSPRLAVGGAGVFLPSGRDVPGDIVFPNRAVRFGYGGLVLEVGLDSPIPETTMAVRSLLGGGNVDLEDRDTGARLSSDNVAVLEPGIVVRRSGSSRFHAGLSLGWRVILGLGDTEGVNAADLSGPALEIHLRLGPL